MLEKLHSPDFTETITKFIRCSSNENQGSQHTLLFVCSTSTQVHHSKANGPLNGIEQLN